MRVKRLLADVLIVAVLILAIALVRALDARSAAPSGGIASDLRGPLAPSHRQGFACAAPIAARCNTLDWFPE
jgi:hypothetical protein